MIDLVPQYFEFANGIMWKGNHHVFNGIEIADNHGELYDAIHMLMNNFAVNSFEYGIFLCDWKLNLFNSRVVCSELYMWYSNFKCTNWRS